jgi:UDP-N-acetylmuramyl pentapeptide phosphotransferase/UDP-N-acetylglucosamine-1-phosphate transferase
LVGLAEDITKTVSIRMRLIAAIISGSLAFYLMDVRILSLGLPFIDPVIQFMPFSFIITVFAITGLINSYNIIDGNNGLASMLAIITFMGIGIIAHKYSDELILFLCIVMASSLFGFFLINFPRGLIFLGDSGAYLIGFILSITTISLIQRHESISPFAGLLMNALPVTETIFSIYRRKYIRGKNPSHADQLHLHSLVYRRLITSKKRFIITIDANPKTSIYIWIFACFSIAPSVIFPENSPILIIALIIFISLFLYLYWRLVKGK